MNDIITDTDTALFQDDLVVQVKAEPEADIFTQQVETISQPSISLAEDMVDTLSEASKILKTELDKPLPEQDLESISQGAKALAEVYIDACQLEASSNDNDLNSARAKAKGLLSDAAASLTLSYGSFATEEALPLPLLPLSEHADIAEDIDTRPAFAAGLIRGYIAMGDELSEARILSDGGQAKSKLQAEILVNELVDQVAEGMLALPGVTINGWKDIGKTAMLALTNPAQFARMAHLHVQDMRAADKAIFEEPLENGVHNLVTLADTATGNIPGQIQQARMDSMFFDAYSPFSNDFALTEFLEKGRATGSQAAATGLANFIDPVDWIAPGAGMAPVVRNIAEETGQIASRRAINEAIEQAAKKADNIDGAVVRAVFAPKVSDVAKRLQFTDGNILQAVELTMLQDKWKSKSPDVTPDPDVFTNLETMQVLDTLYEDQSILNHKDMFTKHDAFGHGFGKNGFTRYEELRAAVFATNGERYFQSGEFNSFEQTKSNVLFLVQFFNEAANPDIFPGPKLTTPSDDLIKQWMEEAQEQIPTWDIMKKSPGYEMAQAANL
jgi:hypothetical protein